MLLCYFPRLVAVNVCRHYDIAVTQEHGMMEGRNIVREETTSGYAKTPDFASLANPLERAARAHNEAHEAHAHGDKGHGEKGHGEKELVLADSRHCERSGALLLCYFLALPMSAAIFCDDGSEEDRQA